MRKRTIAGAVVSACAAALAVASSSGAAGRTWAPCSKTATKAAAGQAGVPERMDADERLKRVFGDRAPSSVLTTIARSFCADFDGDGDVDRAALYKCCTVSSPSPIVILRNAGGGDYAIAYSRLNDAVFSLRASGRDLVEREPKYARTDPNCCPSQIRERRIHWNGRRFATTIRIRKA